MFAEGQFTKWCNLLLIHFGGISPIRTLSAITWGCVRRNIKLEIWLRRSNRYLKISLQRSGKCQPRGRHWKLCTYPIYILTYTTQLEPLQNVQNLYAADPMLHLSLIQNKSWEKSKTVAFWKSIQTLTILLQDIGEARRSAIFLFQLSTCSSKKFLKSIQTWLSGLAITHLTIFGNKLRATIWTLPSLSVRN